MPKHFTTVSLAITSCISLSAFAADQLVAEISRLNNPFQLNPLTPFSMGDVMTDRDLCVYSSTGVYTVTVRGDGPSQEFTTNVPNVKPINYQIWWNNAQGTAGNFQLLAGQVSDLQIQTGESNCTTDSNNPGHWVNLQVVIRDVELRGISAGSYAPTLQIEITPLPVS